MENTNSIKTALAALEAAEWKMGDAWEAAHELAQAHEGEPLYDRLHAICHRMEGDAANAAYWYRRARVDIFTESIAEEAEMLISEL